MNIRKKIFLPLLALALAAATLVFTACNNNEEVVVDPAAVVSSVTLSNSAVFLNATGEENRTAAVTASFSISEEGADVQVSWSSSAQNVAKVEGSIKTEGEGDEARTVYTGTITAQEAGLAVITATAGNKSATCIVAVTDSIVSDSSALTAAAAAAQNGAVIALNAGQYTADVTVAASAKNVSLVGAGAGNVTLTGSVAFGGGSCYLTGITIDATGKNAAVTASASDANLTMRGVTVRGAENGVSFSVGAETAEEQSSLSVYDCTFDGVTCAMSADKLSAAMRVTFTNVTYQWHDANGWYAAIGGTPVADPNA